MKLWCCQCRTNVEARLTSGTEIYPHRPDLANLPCWKCDGCGNHVGTHHKTDNPTRPLGNIPSTEVKNARIKIHELIDPVWKSGKVSRTNIYRAISKELGYVYHAAEIKTMDEARIVYHIANRVVKLYLNQK